MSPAEIDRFDDVLADVLDLPRAAVTQELAAETCEAWDSAAHLRLVFALEDAFDVRFSRHDIERALTRGSLLATVRAKLSA
jgi:acyl carrier protein